MTKPDLSNIEERIAEPEMAEFKLPVFEWDTVVDGVTWHVVYDQNKFFSPAEIEKMRLTALLEHQKMEERMREEMLRREAEYYFGERR